MKQYFKILYIISLTLALGGCGKDKTNNEPIETPIVSENPTTPEPVPTQSPEPTVEPTVEPTPEPIDYSVVKPNEIGNIMVVMYHGIIEDNPPYHRSEADFRKDLQYMYDHNYRLISLADYVNSDIDIPAGYTPIVLTFDDGLESTFSLEEVNGKLVPKAGTAVAILEEFCSEHPDFGKAAAFFINGGDGSTFPGAGTYEERLKWLVDNGYELGNHTYSHPKLNKLDAAQIQEEIGKVDARIKEVLPNYNLNVISYPHGIRPQEEYMSYITSGTYDSKTYSYVIGLREGVSGPMVAPLHVKFNPLNCPRVRGSEGEESDMWWYFDYYEKYPEYKYVSDGDPNTIAVPEDAKDNVNMELLGDKKLIVY